LLDAAAAYGDRGQADCRWLPATHLGLDHAPLMRAAADHSSVVVAGVPGQKLHRQGKV